MEVFSLRFIYKLNFKVEHKDGQLSPVYSDFEDAQIGGQRA